MGMEAAATWIARSICWATVAVCNAITGRFANRTVHYTEYTEGASQRTALKALEAQKEGAPRQRKKKIVWKQGAGREQLGECEGEKASADAPNGVSDTVSGADGSQVGSHNVVEEQSRVVEGEKASAVGPNGVSDTLSGADGSQVDFHNAVEEQPRVVEGEKASAVGPNGVSDTLSGADGSQVDFQPGSGVEKCARVGSTILVRQETLPPKIEASATREEDVGGGAMMPVVEILNHHTSEDNKSDTNKLKQYTKALISKQKDRNLALEKHRFDSAEELNRTIELINNEIKKIKSKKQYESYSNILVNIESSPSGDRGDVYSLHDGLNEGDAGHDGRINQETVSDGEQALKDYFAKRGVEDGNGGSLNDRGVDRNERFGAAEPEAGLSPQDRPRPRFKPRPTESSPSDDSDDSDDSDGYEEESLFN